MYQDRSNSNRSTGNTAFIKHPNSNMLSSTFVQQGSNHLRFQQQLVPNGPLRSRSAENGYNVAQVASVANQPHRFGQQQQPGHAHSSDLPVRMLVNAKYIGALIGQGGVNIRQISRESKARCVVDVNRGIREPSGTVVEKAVNIYGTPESCTTACLKIFELILREARNDPLNQGKNIEPEMKLLAHNNLVGRLIGKNGSCIKKIMEETSCVIFLSNFADMSVFNTERTVTVRGSSLSHISAAEARISAKLRVCWDHDMSNSMYAVYGAALNPHLQSQMAPVFSGCPLPYSQFATTAAPPVGYAAAAATFGGGLGGRQAASFAGVGTPGAVSPAAVLQAAPGVGRFDSPIDSRTEVCYVWVPASVIGALIGTKGANIRQIMRLTGAHVRIETPRVDATVADAAAVAAAASSESGVGQSSANGDLASSPPQAQKQPSRSTVSRGGPGTERRVAITGTEMQQYKCQFWIYQRICEQGYTFFDDVRLCTEIHVPSVVVGRLIGRKGQNIRELQRYTGAHVRIIETVAGGDGPGVDGNVVARITGNFNASQAVQSRIRQLVYQAAVEEHSGTTLHRGGGDYSEVSDPVASDSAAEDSRRSPIELPVAVKTDMMVPNGNIPAHGRKHLV